MKNFSGLQELRNFVSSINASSCNSTYHTQNTLRRSDAIPSLWAGVDRASEPGAFCVMSSKKTYAEKLKDPRWQKKRLEILQRDNWQCSCCLDEEQTLHVHHFQYENNPWDSNEIDLITLCESCHHIITFCEKEYELKFKLSPFQLGFKIHMTPSKFVQLIFFPDAIAVYQSIDKTISYIPGPHAKSMVSLMNCNFDFWDGKMEY